MRFISFFAAPLVIIMLASCASRVLPPRLTSEESVRLSELPLPYTVGVEPFMYPVYSDKLNQALQDAGIFSRVAPLSDFKSPPDFIATVEKTVYGNAVIPVVLFASAGVIPLVTEEDHGLIFSLAPSSRRRDKVIIDASYSGNSTLGWAALAVNAAPDYTFSDPDQSERFRRMLGYRTLIVLRPKR